LFSTDPTDCFVYHDCTSISEPIRWQCPNGTPYNAATRMCDASAQCNIIDCDLIDALILPYATDSQYYIYCDLNDEDRKVPIVMRCPDDRIFDPITFACPLQLV
jgi:hypothetical protein